MPRTVRTARGAVIDFDVIILKQQLAQAPMNIEVARRKEFIDSKEGKTRGSKIESEVSPIQAINAPAPVEVIIPESVEVIKKKVK
jgi:hypothetical protein